MAEVPPNQLPRPAGGSGGFSGGAGLASRGDAVLAGRALRNGWLMDARERRDVVEQLLADALTAESARARTAAARALVAADMVNVGRERNALTERHGDVSSLSSLLRAAGASPEGRELLCQLTALAARQAEPTDEAQGET